MSALICRGHTRPVVDLCFTNTIDEYNSSFIISASKDGEPMLRSGITGDWIGTYSGSHKGATNCVSVDQFTRDPEQVRCVTGSADYSAIIWEAFSGKALHTINHSHMVRAVSLGRLDCNDSLPSSHLLSCTNQKDLLLWDLNKLDSGQILKIDAAHKTYIKKVIWHPFRSDCAITAADDSTVCLWDLRSGQITECVTLEDNRVVKDMEVSVYTDKKILFTCSDKSMLVDLSSSEGNQSLSNAFSNALKFLLPGKPLSASRATLDKLVKGDDVVIVCGGSDNILFKCKINSTGEVEILETHSGVHFGAINCVRYSPDQHIYATASDDGTLRLFPTFIDETYGLWRAEAEHVTTNGVSDHVDCSPKLSSSLTA